MNGNSDKIHKLYIKTPENLDAKRKKSVKYPKKDNL